MAAKASSPRKSTSTAQAPTVHNGGTTAPASATGVTSSVTQGIATRLASKPASENSPNHSKVNGANASVISPWVRAMRLNAPRTPSPACGSGPPVANSTATATKLSQNPARNRAQGSSQATRHIAASHITGQGQRRPLSCSPTTAVSIQMARCAGTPQPENTAYPQPSARPPTAAATGKGTASNSPGQKRLSPRHSPPTTATASQANKVMCIPETTTKCVTPVRRNFSHNGRAIAP